jgi:hypothetical protein
VITGNPERPELGEELTDGFRATDPDMAHVFVVGAFVQAAIPGSGLVVPGATGHRPHLLYWVHALREIAGRDAGVPPEDFVEALTGLPRTFGDGLDGDTALLAPGAPSPARPDSDPTTKNTP